MSKFLKKHALKLAILTLVILVLSYFGSSNIFQEKIILCLGIIVCLKTFDLFITGTYNIEQANDMLKALYKSLINYHKIENLSTQVRYDTLNNEALEAIEKLKQEIQDIDQTINVARLIDKKIKIKSTIEVYYE
jgi:hypothetical protein